MSDVGEFQDGQIRTIPGMERRKKRVPMMDFPTEPLTAWLSQTLSLDIAEIQVDKFAGGQSNPTYRISLGTRSYVLRRKPFGKLLPSAHAIEREFRLISALHPAGFPVPTPYALCDDTTVIGAPFYVMEMIEGQNHSDGCLPGMKPARRRVVYEQMVDTLAALHSVDFERAGLADFGRPGNFFERQVTRWIKQYRASQTDDIPEIEHLIEWLPRTIPEQRSTSIIHGDYRIDNLIYGQDDHVAAVIDWELATLGDPLSDLAYLAMNWVLPADGRASLEGSDLDQLGIPPLDVIVQRYAHAMRLDEVPALPWYFAFNLFRLVGILQGVKKRAAEGNASSAEADLVIARIEPFAKAAWEQAGLSGKG